MNASLENYNYINHSHTWLPKESIYSAEVPENISSHNTSQYGTENDVYENVENAVLMSILVISIFGALGNGAVIWLLGFQIKRNPFITYILNLAMADFGLLVSLPFLIASWWLKLHVGAETILLVFNFLFQLMYSTSQFLLMAISLDRCVAVFLPLWHRCHRPPHLSTIVCTLIWVLSVLLTGMTYLRMFIDSNSLTFYHRYQLLFNAAVGLPLITIATVALFVKVCFKTQLNQKGKLLTIILLSLFFFLLFAFPYNIICILYSYDRVPLYILQCAIGFCVLNSSVNPVIYTLVGREKKLKHRQSMKVILQKVFKEEEGSTEETEVETQMFSTPPP